MSYEGDVSTIKAKVREIREKATELYVRMGPGMIQSPEQINAELDWIGEAYKVFYERDPRSLSSIMADLEGIKTQLTDPATTKMETVKGDIRDWQGDAAETFLDNFLTPFPQTVANQVELVLELHTAIAASKKILDTGRADAIGIADTAILALDRASQMEDKNEAIKDLTTVGAVAGIVAALPTMGTGPGALALGMAMVGGTVAIESAKAGAKPITGTEPNSILEQMNDALLGLDSAMTQEEDILAKVLRKDAETVDGNMRKILPARPDIADKPSAKEFRLPVNPGS